MRNQGIPFDRDRLGKSLTEKAITKQIKQLLYQIGAFPVQTHGPGYQDYRGEWHNREPYHPGVTDLIACVDGKFVGIEVKRPGQKMTEKQELFQHEVRAAGGKAFVAYSVDDVVRELGLDVKLYPMFARGRR